MSPYSTFPTAKLDKRARSPIHPKTQITVDGNGLKKPIPVSYTHLRAHET